MKNLFALLLLFHAETADAQSSLDLVAQSLAKQGYEVVEVRRTWLGRTLIVAVDPNTGIIREIVIERGSGRIINESFHNLSDGSSLTTLENDGELKGFFDKDRISGPGGGGGPAGGGGPGGGGPGGGGPGGLGGRR